MTWEESNFRGRILDRLVRILPTSYIEDVGRVFGKRRAKDSARWRTDSVTDFLDLKDQALSQSCRVVPVPFDNALETEASYEHGHSFARSMHEMFCDCTGVRPND